MNKFALIGAELSYSFSKLIHTAFGRYEYELLSVPPEKLRETVFNERYSGFNITNPYKRAVMQYCGEITPQARDIGCVNTLIKSKNGILGANTDYFGFIAMANRAGINFSGKKALILGNGGARLTAFAAMRDGGAREIVTVSRSGEVNYGNVYEHYDCDIIVNATPVGTYPNNGRKLVELERFPNCSGVLDVVYNPLRSALVLNALRLNIPCSGGLPMLVGQAEKGCELFSGEPLPDGVAENVLRKLSGSLTNIVLIGMPGCGKTSVGKKISELTGRRLIDTDEEVEKAAGMSVANIFESFGEERFRELEREAVKNAGALTGVIIATGGGIVKNESNYDNIAQNGRIYYITRPTEQLSTAGRPLSANADAVEALARERSALYEQFCDFKLANENTPEFTAREIMRDFNAIFA